MRARPKETVSPSLPEDLPDPAVLDEVTAVTVEDVAGTRPLPATAGTAIPPRPHEHALELRRARCSV
jgi:hypothetical protein